MKYLFVVLISFLALGVNANNYMLNQSHIDELFDNSADVSLFGTSTVLQQRLNEIEKFSSAAASGSADKQTVAAIIAFAEWALGIGVLIPIHRIYLGMGGEGFKVIALYCVTCGGVGLLPLVDGIMLLIDDSGTKYIDNPKFLMWLD